MKFLILFLSLFLVFATQELMTADSDEICMECHSEKTLHKMKKGKRISLYVDYKVFKKSIHKDNGCTSCHSDVDPDDLPHAENLNKVDCSDCHDKTAAKYKNSLHGKAHSKGKYLAPSCVTCHSKHNILSKLDEKSPTFVMNIPNLCGDCHKEGTPVSKLINVRQRHILENYKQSIHGDGLFKRGLIVTAVCTSCHNSHDILPHTDPKSSINRYNVPKTCMQCHRNIEKVHTKVIDGKLWESKPHKIPVCVDCHQPHKTRKVLYEGSFPKEYCLNCHSKKDIHKSSPTGKNGSTKEHSLYVDVNKLHSSSHKDISCIKCHTNVNPDRKPVCINSGKVDCSMCHSEVVGLYGKSVHGTLYAKGDHDAPYCTDCHTNHQIKSHKDESSPTFVKNIPNLCGKCHREGKPASRQYIGNEHEVVKNYNESIHGKGLSESGLIVTATCIDCHTSHSELPAKDTKSTVNRNNISKTCGKCHLGIYEKLNSSVHSPLVTKTEKELPVCHDCHFAHKINRVDMNNFRKTITNQCGRCHQEVAETYFDTFHGKVSKLGSNKTAKCYDCHGAHDILPVSNPKSRLSHDNIVKTCKNCHENSNRKFVGYLTHATHHNEAKYPFLYYTFWFMTILLVGTFSFFGLHTLLWIPRSIAEKRKRRKEKDVNK